MVTSKSYIQLKESYEQNIQEIECDHTLYNRWFEKMANKISDIVFDKCYVDVFDKIAKGIEFNLNIGNQIVVTICKKYFDRDYEEDIVFVTVSVDGHLRVMNYYEFDDAIDRLLELQEKINYVGSKR